MISVSPAKARADSTFGRIEPSDSCGSNASASLASELADLFLILVSEVAIDRRHLGEDDRALGVELAREQRRGSILVDHRVHPRESPVALRDRDAAAAAGDRDRAGVDEPTDRVELHDLERLGEGTTRRWPRFASDTSAQPRSRSSTLGLLGRVERADRLRRPVERRIVGRDTDMREHAGDRASAQGRSQLGGDERADLRLGLRNREPQRQRWSFRGGAFLPEQLVPDLRAVAVRDREISRVGEQRLQGGDCATKVRKLLDSCAALAGSYERVAAEGDDRAHTSAVSSSPFSASTSFSVGSPIS